MAKYDLGKGRLKPMQSAVSPFTVHDLRGALWRFAVLLCHIALHVLCCQLIVADHLLCILARRCQLAAAFGGGSRFQGCYGYLPFPLRLLLAANLSGTSSQVHLFVMSLTITNCTTKYQAPCGIICGFLMQLYNS